MLKLPSLFIPMVDNGMKLVHKAFLMSVIGMLQAKVFEDRSVLFPDLSFPYPDTARNIATYWFLKTGMDRFVYLDTDLQYTHQHVRMLISHDDEPFVTGIHPKKQLGLVFPIVPLPENPNPFRKGSPDMVEVEKGPGGIMCLHRSVFELLKNHPEVGLHHNDDVNDDIWNFWQQTPGGESDDFNLCRRYREVGGRVMVDQRCLVKHAGSVIYPIEGTYDNDGSPSQRD